MTTKKLLHRLLVGTVSAALPFAAIAQKLPDSQESSVRAPKTVKIDGKANEWGTLQAFNKSTEVGYTVANDDSTLYLVVQANVGGVVGKILSGGITLALNTDGKKKEKDAVSITFPVSAAVTRGVTSGPGVTINGGRSGSVVVSGSPGGASVSSDPAAMKKRRDSLTFVNNNKTIEKSKDVKVKGMVSITDSLLSIYNEEGIKARCSYTEAGTYTYELAVPLKYLGMSVHSPKEFLYNLKLNGISLGSSVAGITSIVVNGGAGGGGGQSDFMSMFSPTDFWGKYTLVK